MSDSAQAKSGIFYGWILVFAAFIAFGMVYGTVLYSFAVFATPVAKAFGAKPAQIQLAFFATNVGTGILGIYAGRLLAKYSKRNCIIAGLAYLAAAYVGGSAGGILPVWPGLVAFRFGRNALPQVMGLMGPIVVSLQGFGAPLAAQLHYKLAFELFLGFLVASVIITRNLNKPAAG